MNENQDKVPRETAREKGAPKARAGLHRLKIALALLSLIAAGGYAGLRWWEHRSTRVSTDNAYVNGHIVLITPRISGTVVEVAVEDNQFVKEGQLIVQLDRRDYEVALQQAEAAVETTKAKLEAAKLGVPLQEDQTEANITESEARVEQNRKLLTEAEKQMLGAKERERGAKANLEKVGLDRKRVRDLWRSGVLPQDKYDAALKDYEMAEANYQAAVAARQALEANIRSLHDQIRETLAQLELARTGGTVTKIRKHEARSLEAELKQAEAAVESARLKLIYTKIDAPVSGYVSKKNVELGQSVTPGQPLMAVVPLHNAWVEANFKETQLTNVRVGQPAEIRADIYPGYVYKGRVESISAGTGAVFSLLPPENATGNWVKVVQRLPVKIVLDDSSPPDKPLRLGLSVKATIYTSDQRGGTDPLPRSAGSTLRKVIPSLTERFQSSFR